MCGINAFEAQWLGSNFTLHYTSLNMTVLSHKTALSSKLWSSTIPHYKFVAMEVYQPFHLKTFLTKYKRLFLISAEPDLILIQRKISSCRCKVYLIGSFTLKSDNLGFYCL